MRNIVVFPYDRRIGIARKAAAQLWQKRDKPREIRRIVSALEVNATVNLRTRGIPEREIQHQIGLLARAVEREFDRIETRHAHESSPRGGSAA